MRIHKEGYRIILVTGLVCAIIALIFNLILPHQTVLHYILYLALMVFLFIIIQFFRIPERTIKTDTDVILCPADGTIVAIEEVHEPEFFNDTRRQISIFMSPSNVHVNRYPVSGKIVYTNYWPGSFLVAWHPKSSTENERNTVVIDHSSYGPVMVRQIAGALARRIVCYSKTNERITQGLELGFIKFGSRVDLFLPLSANINVHLEEKVKGGVTIIGTFNRLH
ncbi:MAG TPA: phosphatidylserine decarboxylase family protein [Bacteroidales bacterium]|nr:phosphatidylserine decarboxylase family protein [Bacteroidales bacterium]